MKRRFFGFMGVASRGKNIGMNTTSPASRRNELLRDGCRLCVYTILVLCLSLRCDAYSDLIVFGDSLSDTGNVHANSFGFAAADPYVDGRLTNGLNYVDYLSQLLGLAPPLYSEAGGLNHAHGGAQVLQDPLSTAWVIDSLEIQKTKYLDANQGVADPDALYIVFGGGNDVRDTSVGMVDTAMNLVSIVDALLAAGATNVLVPNLPDLGLTPEVTEFGQGAGAASSARSQQFNATLASELSTRQDVITFDVFAALNEIVADTAAGGSEFGFTNVVDDCWEGGPAGLFSGFGLGDGLFPAPVCDNPDEYLFWDIVHPTTAAHEFLANEIFAKLTPVVTGDFDGNGQFECTDIDALVAVIAAGTDDLEFDLTGDAMVDLADRDAWLAEAGAANLSSGNSYLLGDATLDGNVDGTDFLRWNSNKFTATAAWCSGDFNADGSIDGVDFLEWNGHKFQSADEFVAVPETCVALQLLIAFFALPIFNAARAQGRWADGHYDFCGGETRRS